MAGQGGGGYVTVQGSHKVTTVYSGSYIAVEGGGVD